MAQGSSIWTVANALTAIRILLIMPFLYLVNEGSFALALIVFFIASVTDFVDGYVARRFGQQSRLGQLLDPLADKLLVTASFIVMAIPRAGFDPIPLWLVIAVIARDILILLGSLVVYLVTGFKQFKPTFFGKVNTFLELGLIVIFLGFNTAGILISLLPLCYGVVMASVIVSGSEYIIEGLRILRSRPSEDQTPMN